MRRATQLAAWGLALFAPVALFSAPAQADIVYLKDGSKLEGEILRKTDAGWAIKTPDGKTSNIDADRIKSIEAKRAGGNSGEEPMKRLASLRSSLESQTDVRKILERYRKFIEQHIGTPAADEALKDVQVWEDRLEKGMVKLGDKWVTKAEQEALRANGAERAAAARRLLVQGRNREAMTAIESALAEDPQNAAAHYLRGVVLFRQDQTANSRKAFDTVVQLVPNHGPTLNNIAVIMWRAKQYPGAINYYGQAMNAIPGTRQVLDNVAEALNELPQNQRDNAVTKKVVLLFNAQDMALQSRMKKRGLFRWGSTWVKEQELKQLKAEEDRVEDKLAKLEDEFEQVQDRIEQIDRDIGDTERSIRRIEASSYGRDATGRPVRLSYPRLYYDLKRDLEQLYSERDSEKAKIVRLRKKAKQVRQEVTIPRYAGVQQMIGVEGAPELPPLTEAELGENANAAAPATGPAVRAR
jgi:Flp pilus assembly protein TadD